MLPTAPVRLANAGENVPTDRVPVREKIGLGAGRVVVDGTHLRARWVFDSVIGPEVPPPADAHMSFRGWYVRSERAAFDE